MLNNIGKNSGIKNGIQYFKAKLSKSGIFVKQNGINMKSIKKQNDSSKLSLNSEIKINGCKGVIKYIGIPSDNKGNKDSYYGIILDKNNAGTCNGTFKSIKYFKCNNKKGIFIKCKDIDSKMKVKKVKKKKKNPNKRSSSSIRTISHSINAKNFELNKTKYKALIESLPEYIKTQWNNNYSSIIHEKYVKLFVDILIHLNMMKYHLNDSDLRNSLTYIFDRMKDLKNNCGNNISRVIFLDDELLLNVINIDGIERLLKLFGWSKMKDVFIFFCDGLTSNVQIQTDIKDGKTSKFVKDSETKLDNDIVYVDNSVELLELFIEQNKHDISVITEELNENEGKSDTKNDDIELSDDIKINNINDYSLSIVEKIFKSKVDIKNKSSKYKCFNSEIPIYAKKKVLQNDLDIWLCSYEWDTFPDFEYRCMVFTCETDKV